MPMFIDRRRLAEEARTILSELGTERQTRSQLRLSSAAFVPGLKIAAAIFSHFTLNAVMGADSRVHSIEVAGHWAQIRTGRSQAVVIELPEAVSGFMFMFDTWHFCFGTDALGQSQEGEESPAASEPSERSENPAGDGDPGGSDAKRMRGG